jgi:hypothetical protein
MCFFLILLILCSKRLLYLDDPSFHEIGEIFCYYIIELVIYDLYLLIFYTHNS